MLKSLYSGISGMHAFQTKLDVIGNNIANVNTVGFKTGRVMFSDILSQTVQGASAGNGNGIAGTNPQQIGLGTQISNIDTIFTNGSPETTNNPLDVAISGDGFFTVSNDGGTTQYYTRAGDFSIDNNGYLTLPNGYQVLDSNGSPIQIPSGSKFTSIAPDGTVTYSDLATGTPTKGPQIGLTVFPNPAGLTKIGGNMYQASDNSNPGGATSLPTPVAPGTGGTNQLQVGTLEMSNVDLTNEFAEMIVAQQGFNANSKIITTDNQILQTVVNLKQ
ncbi:flagellar basal-body rod protein FlgF [Fodinisporobacter ferrooxydans]|uniref:Flagellar basal-body rod protein FlgF n=1 Tax=Fodinisporobacter ferrooxydans TaxID=2901836 RepID=A0ABY4CG27_9BACL|nr:flagellar basal-body rod protein FlgF [Alicyclobacillaceae bacterium MYW30-H2]